MLGIMFCVPEEEIIGAGEDPIALNETELLRQTNIIQIKQVLLDENKIYKMKRRTCKDKSEWKHEVSKEVKAFERRAIEENGKMTKCFSTKN